MKGSFSRKLLCLLLVLVLTAALSGCGKTASAPEKAAAVPGFFLTAEYDRLYFAPARYAPCVRTTGCTPLLRTEASGG